MAIICKRQGVGPLNICVLNYSVKMVLLHEYIFSCLLSPPLLKLSIGAFESAVLDLLLN